MSDESTGAIRDDAGAVGRPAGAFGGPGAFGSAGASGSAAGVFGSEDPGLPSLCSARGCGAPASWELRWNNPKIHQPERRKTWLACDEHKDSLSDFLGRRSFLREVEPFAG